MTKASSPRPPGCILASQSERTTQWFRLDGRVALVTGGYGGIGLAVCHGLSAAGARVAVAGRDQEKAERAAEAIRAAGGDAFPVSFDATKPGEVHAMADRVAAHFGRIDVLVNTIG